MAIIRTHYAFAQVPIDRSTSGRIIDSHALAGYCRLWSRWRKADDFITKHGDTYPLKDESGKIKSLMQFPQVSIAMKLARQLTRPGQEFGMTPSARTRIKTTPATTTYDDEKAANSFRGRRKGAGASY